MVSKKQQLFFFSEVNNYSRKKIGLRIEENKQAKEKKKKGGYFK